MEGIDWMKDNDFIPFNIPQEKYLLLIVQFLVYDFSDKKQIYVQNLFEIGFNQQTLNYIQRIEFIQANSDQSIIIALFSILIGVYMYHINRFLIESTTIFNAQVVFCDFIFLLTFGIWIITIGMNTLKSVDFFSNLWDFQENELLKAMNDKSFFQLTNF